MLKKKVLMVYPRQGFGGTFVRHIPLGLLYASVELVKNDFDVEIFDARTVEGDWRTELKRRLSDEVLCLGISVMSGSPIREAVDIGAFVKELVPNIPIIWGGPHATFCPDLILRDDPNVDYVVSGYASKSFHQLCESIQENKLPTEIAGISWRENGEVQSNAKGDKTFEYIDYRDIPYHLIDDYSVYGQLAQNRKIFSMYSALGCPYKCSFCSSPAQYSTIDGKKWIPLEHEQIVDHIEYLVENYDADYIYFIDDDSFPKLKHVEGIIDEINRRGVRVGLGFRGARINEIKRMSDDFLSKLAAAGTDIMHIGAESGSNRILNLIRKDCTREDIIECNKKLARHPTITSMYNFMMGVPTETIDELKETRDLMFQLIEDNPNCIVNPPNKFRPLPGTELYELAQQEWGYVMPSTLDAWAEIENEAGCSTDGWYSPEVARFLNVMLVAAYFIDNKVGKLLGKGTWFTALARVANFTYAPVARFRLKNNFTRFFLEYKLFIFAAKLLTHGQGKA